jgi:hypothetical protein
MELPLFIWYYLFIARQCSTDFRYTAFYSLTSLTLDYHENKSLNGIPTRIIFLHFFTYIFRFFSNFYKNVVIDYASLLSKPLWNNVSFNKIFLDQRSAVNDLISCDVYTEGLNIGIFFSSVILIISPLTKNANNGDFTK